MGEKGTIYRQPRAINAVPPEVIVITGPTAVGKSAQALALAQRLGAEIVSADSRQVYHYMDIGTAKPTVAERASVPHHLVDVVYPNEPFSIASYRAAASHCLGDIAERGKLALVVGGSPHYIQALVDQLEPAPSYPRIRAWLEGADLLDGGARLDAWLQGLDPAAADAIDRHNRRRVLRAIEIVLGSGQRFSEIGRRRGSSIRALWVGLRRDRASLHMAVAARLDRMLEAGWLAEVRTLLEMGYAPSLPSMSATGYAQIARVVRGEMSLDDARLKIHHATHAFIRRQETWLRGESRLMWFDANDPRLADRVVDAWAAFRHNGS